MPEQTFTIFSDEVLLTKGANNGRFCFLYPIEERGPLGDILYRDLLESNKMTYIVEGRSIYLQKVDGTERRLQRWVIPKRTVYRIEDGEYKPYILQSAADEEIINNRKSTLVELINEAGEVIKIAAEQLIRRKPDDGIRYRRVLWVDTYSNELKPVFSNMQAMQKACVTGLRAWWRRNVLDERVITKAELSWETQKVLAKLFARAYTEMDLSIIEPYIASNFVFASEWSAQTLSWTEYKQHLERKFTACREAQISPFYCGPRLFNDNKIFLYLRYQGRPSHITFKVQNNQIISALIQEANERRLL